MNTKLSEELTWRGFVNQTTYSSITKLDDSPITFYWGVDPSADSMTIGHLAIAMMARHFIDHGHKAVLLVGGATGLIGDPDGKAQERDLKTFEVVERNKKSIAEQYKTIFAGHEFETVDNYDWFKGIGYLDFLREVGKHVPMRQMLGREFVQSRLGEDGNGISYAEFSYSLIQGYDFLVLNRDKGASLQLCGADQLGNYIAGVDLIRRIEGKEAHGFSAPLIINPQTGIKFGKSEEGAVWLDPAKTTPTKFYQFWVNADDAGVETYLKVYTLLGQQEVESLLAAHKENPGARLAQKCLAQEVTRLVHGTENVRIAEAVTDYLTGRKSVNLASQDELEQLKKEIASVKAKFGDSIAEILAKAGLVSSNSEGHRVVRDKGVYINSKKITSDYLVQADIDSKRNIIRRGKKFEDSALLELN